MKQFILTLMALITLSIGLNAKVRTVREFYADGSPKRIIEVKDTVINGRQVADTLSITTYSTETPAKESESYAHYHSSGIDFSDIDISESIVAVLTILLIFGSPLLIVIAVLYFRYRNRRAKYRLIEKAIACGHPLPVEYIEEIQQKDTRTKGIKNICLGIGLAIFLQACFDEFALTSIGLLIMFTGIGQLLIHYTTPKK
ncbi:MAG: hypothetical protein E7099_05470 [Mediterranea massiliensis]|nr:hypothetical protein [Mediterranea massiliensis]